MNSCFMVRVNTMSTNLNVFTSYLHVEVKVG